MKAFFALIALPVVLVHGLSVRGNNVSAQPGQVSRAVEVFQGLLSEVTEHTSTIDATVFDNATAADYSSVVDVVNREINDITKAVEDAVAALNGPNTALKAREFHERRQDGSDASYTDIIKLVSEIVHVLVQTLGPIVKKLGKDIVKSLPSLVSAFFTLLPLFAELSVDLLQAAGPFLQLLLPLILG